MTSNDELQLFLFLNIKRLNRFMYFILFKLLLYQFRFFSENSDDLKNNEKITDEIANNNSIILNPSTSSIILLDKITEGLD